MLTDSLRMESSVNPEAIINFAVQEAAKVEAALKKANSPADLKRVTCSLHRRIDELFVYSLNASGQKIDCRSGCSFCCYFKVDAQPHEIFRLVDFLRERFMDQDIAEIKAKAEANSKKTVNMSAEQQMTTNIPCPLLKDDKCICYEARPIMCRKHHSRDVSLCRQMFHNPSLELPNAEIAQISIPLAAVITMAQGAYGRKKYDARPYDLSSALFEALSNPKCEKRWRDGKSAFPKTALAKEPSDLESELPSVMASNGNNEGV